MKNIVSAATALTLISLFAGAAQADDYKLSAITKDNKQATLTVDVTDPGEKRNLSLEKVKEIAKNAFTRSAQGMDSTDFVTPEGAKAFKRAIMSQTGDEEPSAMPYIRFDFKKTPPAIGPAP